MNPQLKGILFIVLFFVGYKLYSNIMSNIIKKEEEKVKKQDIIKLPTIYKYMGFLSLYLLLFVTLSLIFFATDIKKELIKISFFIVILLALSFIMLLRFHNWKIEFSSKEVIYTNLFGIRRIYSINTVQVNEIKNKYLLCVGEKLITKIPYTYQNALKLKGFVNKYTKSNIKKQK